MRRHKAVARIFLFLSIVNFTLASIAQTPITREARVVAEVSEMGHAQSSSSSSSSSSEPPESSRRPSALLQSRIDFIPAASFSKDSKEPDEDRFFSEELKRKLKEYLILGSIAGVFTGVANGVQKEMMGTVSPGVQTVGRRAVEDLDERSEDQKDPLSRSLSSMKDEDLQMLSFVSRRMLNSLDQESGSQE